MRQFKVDKTEGRYVKTCVVCGKLHKRGYFIKSLAPPEATTMRMGKWGFVCSKRCAEMRILQAV